MPEVNANLVCGARLSADPPYLEAAVVPVPVPHQSAACKNEEINVNLKAKRLISKKEEKK